MFFPDRIISIKDTDKVLEIGPGSTPYFRSDVFLEKEYKTQEEQIAQSGYSGILTTDKRIVTYTGDRFPFEDNEFDYIICSHVLEHVNNPDSFLNEIQRVGKKGYLEFPTLYYDYIYNIPEHKLFLFYRTGVIYWMTKEESGLLAYKSIQDFFYKTIELGYFDMVNNFVNYFFQGFEWFNKIESQRINDYKYLTYSINDINLPSRHKIVPMVNYANISLKELIKFKISNKLNTYIKKILSIGNKHTNKNIIKLNNYSLIIPDDMMWAFTSGDYYERNVIYFLDKIVKMYKQPVLFDVGANYGYYSLRYSEVCKQVFSFEPVTNTYTILCQNIKINSIVNITTIKSGLSDIAEEKTINLYSSSANNSVFERKIPLEHPLKKIGSELITLQVIDDLVNSAQILPPDIIKIDVEGSELNVLKGAKNTILMHRPTILIEYSANTSIDAGFDRRSLLEAIDLRYYIVYGISENENDFNLISKKDFNNKKISNLIFVPNEIDLIFKDDCN